MFLGWYYGSLHSWVGGMLDLVLFSTFRSHWFTKQRKVLPNSVFFFISYFLLPIPDLLMFFKKKSTFFFPLFFPHPFPCLPCKKCLDVYFLTPTSEMELYSAKDLDVTDHHTAINCEHNCLLVKEQRRSEPWKIVFQIFTHNTVAIGMYTKTHLFIF